MRWRRQSGGALRWRWRWRWRLVCRRSTKRARARERERARASEFGREVPGPPTRRSERDGAREREPARQRRRQQRNGDLWRYSTTYRPPVYYSGYQVPERLANRTFLQSTPRTQTVQTYLPTYLHTRTHCYSSRVVLAPSPIAYQRTVSSDTTSGAPVRHEPSLCHHSADAYQHRQVSACTRSRRQQQQHSAAVTTATPLTFDVSLYSPATLVSRIPARGHMQ